MFLPIRDAHHKTKWQKHLNLFVKVVGNEIQQNGQILYDETFSVVNWENGLLHSKISKHHKVPKIQRHRSLSETIETGQNCSINATKSDFCQVSNCSWNYIYGGYNVSTDPENFRVATGFVREESVVSRQGKVRKCE